MKSPYDVIIKPVVTEKSMDEAAIGKYTFEVDRRANKTEIRQAVEEIFGVQVANVNTMITEGKIKRQGKTSGKTPTVKKAIVRLKAGSKGIEFFDSMAQ